MLLVALLWVCAVAAGMTVLIAVVTFVLTNTKITKPLIPVKMIETQAWGRLCDAGNFIADGQVGQMLLLAMGTNWACFKRVVNQLAYLAPVLTSDSYIGEVPGINTLVDF